MNDGALTPTSLVHALGLGQFSCRRLWVVMVLFTVHSSIVASPIPGSPVLQSLRWRLVSGSLSVSAHSNAPHAGIATDTRIQFWRTLCSLSPSCFCSSDRSFTTGCCTSLAYCAGDSTVSLLCLYRPFVLLWEVLCFLYLLYGRIAVAVLGISSPVYFFGYVAFFVFLVLGEWTATQLFNQHINFGAVLVCFFGSSTAFWA